MAKTSTRGGTLTAQLNGPKLKELRGKRKQKEIEQMCDISTGQLTRFETGKPVGIKYILALANFYGVSPKELLATDGLTSTSELLTELAKLHGARLDFSPNGDKTEGNTVSPIKFGRCIYCSLLKIDLPDKFCREEKAPEGLHDFGNGSNDSIEDRA